MMELADMQDLGVVTSGKFFIPSPAQKTEYADMAELADVLYLGYSALQRVGSNHTIRNIKGLKKYIAT